jgi:hypothetical protein
MKGRWFIAFTLRISGLELVFPVRATKSLARCTASTYRARMRSGTFATTAKRALTRSPLDTAVHLFALRSTSCSVKSPSAFDTEYRYGSDLLFEGRFTGAIRAYLTGSDRELTGSRGGGARRIPIRDRAQVCRRLPQAQTQCRASRPRDAPHTSVCVAKLTRAF